MPSGSATSTKSVQRARKNLTDFLKKLDSVPVEEIAKSAQTIKAEAIAQTPYESGKLEKSVYVRVSRDKKRPGIVAGASARAGGFNYAGIQHEETSYEHPIKGKAHYISDPFNDEVKKLKKRIRKGLTLKNGR